MEELTKFLASCEFATPLYFWIGGALVLLLIFFPWARKRRGLAIDLQYWKRKVAFKSKRVLVLSSLAAIASMLMAGVLSDPQFTTRSSASIYGKPVMLVVDVSGSMGYKGLPGKEMPSSLEKARGVYDDLINRRPDVNFGLLPYSTENYIARYFAYKNELLKDTIENREEIDYISTGTRTGEALGKARLFFADNIKGEDKAIVLITDLEADLDAMVEMASEIQRDLLAGIKIYVIVVGEGKQGAAAYVGSRQSQTEGLKIVEMNDRYGINQICEEISAMQISPIREEEVLLKKSLIPFLIAPILGLIALCLILSETRFRKIP